MHKRFNIFNNICYILLIDYFDISNGLWFGFGVFFVVSNGFYFFDFNLKTKKL